MISDALWDCLVSIDRDLIDYPRLYSGDCRDRILMVRELMRELQAELLHSESPEWRSSGRP